jgi:ribosomal protein S14
MNKNIKNIMHEKIIRINLAKKEIHLNLLKSLGQNNNLHNKIKNYSNYIINKKTKKNFFLSKKHKICLYTGKRSSILNKFNFSRYTIKSLILQNKYTNIKKNNW